jgi:hypothetical protein
MSFKYKELRAHFEQLLAALESIFSVHLTTQRKFLKGKKKKTVSITILVVDNMTPLWVSDFRPKLT